MFDLPKILFKGTISPHQLYVKELNKSSRKIDHLLEQHLKQIWNEKIEKARIGNQKIWDSEMYRFESFTSSKDSLYLELSTIDYSVATGAKHFKEELQNLGEDYFTKGAFVSTLVKTIDNKYIFGELSGKTINSNSVDLIGGILSKTESIIQSGSDLFEFVYTELKEEINIEKNYVDLMELIGIVLTDKFQVSLIFLTHLTIDSFSVLEKFTAWNDNEFKKLITVDSDELGEFLNQLGGYKLKINELFTHT